MFGHLNFVDESPLFEACRCSLCHALGAGYGPVARLFTNYDLALTSLAALDVEGRQLKIRKRICPALSRSSCIAGQSQLQEVLAAVTIILTAEKVRDDEHDEGQPAAGRTLCWLNKRRKKAENVLQRSGFDAGMIGDAFCRQRLLECSGGGDIREFAYPTAEVMAALYAQAARITGRPESIEPMAQIGASLGEIIYLLDSITDYADDLRSGNFNPLHRYGGSATVVTISPVARTEVCGIFADCLENIRLALDTFDASPELHNLLTIRLRERLELALKQSDQAQETSCSSFIGRLSQLSPIALIFFPRMAFAADGRSGAACAEQLIPFAIALFGLNCVLRKLCGQGICGSNRPDRITVNDSCGGKKTYRRDPCTGKYKQDGC